MRGSIGRALGLAAPLAFVVASIGFGNGARAGPSEGGTYSAAQAATGATVYAAKCAQCHGAELEGGAGPALTGANLRTLAKHTKLTVGDMFEFMSQQMPMNDPASLRHGDYAAIMAFVLRKNGYPAGKVPLTYDAALASKMSLTSK